MLARVVATTAMGKASPAQFCVSGPARGIFVPGCDFPTQKLSHGQRGLGLPPLLHPSQGPVHLPGWGCPPGTPGNVRQEEQEYLQDSVPKTHQLYKHWGRHMTSHCNFMMVRGGLLGAFPKCLPMGLSYRVYPFADGWPRACVTSS